MPALIGSAAVVLLLLAVGGLIHRRFGIFERVYIPASVIAGVLGLALLQAAEWPLDATDPSVTIAMAWDGLAWVSPVAETLRGWPGYLIAVVFAAMLLQPPSGKRGGVSARVTACEALMVGVIAMGQAAIGLLLTWLVIRPRYDVPDAFGMLIETGFAGGHGTAAAMGQVYATPGIDFPSGLDLGLLMATAGLVYGTVSGIFWINVVLRFAGRFRVPPGVNRSVGGGQRRDADREIGREVAVAEKSQAASGTVGLGTDQKWWAAYVSQSLWIALAFVLGIGLHGVVGGVAERMDANRLADGAVEETADLVEGSAGGVTADENASAEGSPLGKKLTYTSLVGGFPLFIYTLLGGLVISRVLVRLGRTGWLNGPAGGRISGWAMDGLVVAAITTLNLDAVASFLIPVTILFVGGAIWSAVCLLYLAPRMLPAAYWFELGLINYGMSTGTTATGFVLLRLVDPELRTDAAKYYALAAPFSAPLVGGGLVTLGLPLLLLGRVPIGVSTLMVAAAVAVMILIGRRLNRSDDTASAAE